ncbi:MAG: hypothetical protein RLZZ227_1145 [Pseudomonadota bacterium]|jgi:hypothetical protein
MDIRKVSLLLSLAALGSAANAQDACDANCMSAIATQYMTDVATQGWSKLPWAGQVRYTENNVAMMIGDGFWGAGPSTGENPLILADEESGNVIWYGRTAEHGQLAYHGLRLKVDGGRISEVESYLGREGTPDLFAPLDGYVLHADFSAPVAAANSRDALIATVEGYFDSKQLNDGALRTEIANACTQVVNGVNITQGEHPKAQAAQGCKAQLEIGLYKPVERIRARRYPVVDTARGVVVALSLEDHATRELKYRTSDGKEHEVDVRYPNTRGRMDLFKIVDSEIVRIDGVSVFLPYYIHSLWEE